MFRYRVTPIISPPYWGVISLVFIFVFMSDVQSVYNMLDDRASRYGGTVAQMLDITPPSLWDSPTELTAFWDQRDLSHVFPQSTHAWLANDWDNIIPESPDVNRARGADVMTDVELLDAQLDNELLALDIESMSFDDSGDFASELIDMAFA
jgi:hypothetical protein